MVNHCIGPFHRYPKVWQATNRISRRYATTAFARHFYDGETFEETTRPMLETNVIEKVCFCGSHKLESDGIGKPKVTITLLAKK